MTPPLAALWRSGSRPVRFWLAVACKMARFCIRHPNSSGYLVVQSDGRVIGPVKG